MLLIIIIRIIIRILALYIHIYIYPIISSWYPYFWWQNPHQKTPQKRASHHDPRRVAYTAEAPLIISQSSVVILAWRPGGQPGTGWWTTVNLDLQNLYNIWDILLIIYSDDLYQSTVMIICQLSKNAY